VKTSAYDQMTAVSKTSPARQKPGWYLLDTPRRPTQKKAIAPAARTLVTTHAAAS
jgi:hypothetical protein